MQKLLARFAKDESGATAIEYALIVAGLSVVIGAVLQRIGVALDSVLRTLQQDTIIGASTVKRCKIVDALPSRRCLNFGSDTTFPEGLSDYHGSGGR